MMQRRSAVLRLALLGTMLTWVPFSSAQKAQEGLTPDEYDSVAVIYNAEIAALGERALYPICIGAPRGTSSRAITRYLRKYGFNVSDERICNPPLSHGDFPHGLVIEILKVVGGPAGQLDMQVMSGDNTIHVGVHFAEALRKGTYHLKRNQESQWEIVGYEKEFDYKDVKEEQHGCVPSHSPSQPKK
jgi:hypothetical protein